MPVTFSHDNRGVTSSAVVVPVPSTADERERYAEGSRLDQFRQRQKG